MPGLSKLITRLRRKPVRLVVAAVAVLVLAAVFNARLQTHLANRYLPRQVEQFKLERLHILPWAARVRGLNLHQQGIALELDEAELRFLPWRWLLGTVDLEALKVSDFVLDLRKLPPAEPGGEPFSGIFRLLRDLPAFALEHLSVRGVVHIDDQHALSLSLASAGLAPGTNGVVDLDLTIERASDASHGELAATITLNQNEAGHVVGIDTDALLLLSTPTLAEDENLGIQLSARPIEAQLPDPDDETEFITHIQAERYTLALTKPGPGDDLLSLTVNAQLGIDTHTLSGDYRLETHDGLPLAYLPELTLPDYNQRTEGNFDLDLVTTRVKLAALGAVTLRGLDLVLGDNPALPTELRLDHSLELALDAQTTELSQLSFQVVPDSSAAVVEVALAAPLSWPTATPAAALAAEQSLAVIQIHELPLVWLNGLLAQTPFTDGQLDADFLLSADQGDAVLTAPQATRFSKLQFAQATGSLPIFNLELQPTVRLHDQQLALTVASLSLASSEHELLTASLSASLALAAEQLSGDVALVLDVDINRSAELPQLQTLLDDHTLPDELAAHLEADLNADPTRLLIRSLNSSVNQSGRSPLISLVALEAFSIPLNQALQLPNPDGDLARISIDSLPLKWLNALLPGYSLDGILADASFDIRAAADNRLTATAQQPLRISGVQLKQLDTLLIDEMSLSVSPSLVYAPEQVQLDYRALDIRIDKHRLLAADGAVTLPLEKTGDAPISARGAIKLEVDALHRIPALSAALAELAPKRRWQLRAEYALDATPKRVSVDTLDASLHVDDVSYLTVRNTSKLNVRSQLDAGDTLAAHLSGTATARIEGLSSQLLSDLMPMNALAFNSLTASAELDSDGERLSARLAEAFKLDGVVIGPSEAPLLNSFSLGATADLVVRGQRIELMLDALNLNFDASPEDRALGGQLQIALEPSETVPLKHLHAKLTGLLPRLLQQPVLLPGHRLQQGEFRLDTQVDNNGAIVIEAALDSLVADQPLAIGNFVASAKGTMADDGRGFSFEMPISGHGRSGVTDGLLTASYAPVEGKAAVLGLRFNSKQFLLNDVLAAIDSIRAPAVKTGAKQKVADKKVATEKRALNREADKQAAWDVLPYQALVEYQIDQLFYTDYLIFNAVSGTIALSETQFELRRLAANFHTSPMRLNGQVDFETGSPQPYQLTLTGTVDDFDLNQFFSELVPGTKPQVEGLFSLNFSGRGQTPNLAQLRNDLLFDMQLHSRAGLFRPLPPDSSLMAGASDVLGIVGESLSYLPTGGFGAGAVSRLVNYIARIDYDRINIDLSRDDSRDLVIKQFLVQSPTVSLTAHGGIDYEPGKDILDSPLSLDASLNMSGKGAAILYSMDLLSDTQDNYGYYEGPQFHIRGTPAAPESNFAEIVTAAADGSVTGGITRPLSGIIGNIKHRWFGDEPTVSDQSTGETPDSETDR